MIARRKEPGCCSACRMRLFPADAPVSLRTGWRATYVLADGSFMDLTMCDDCVAGGEDFDAMWDNHIQGLVATAPRMLSPYVNRQLDDGNFILARLYEHRWKDVDSPLVAQLR